MNLASNSNNDNDQVRTQHTPIANAMSEFMKKGWET
jgi:hypothetical protein